MKSALVASAAFVLALPALAQVTSIPPFVGQQSESFSGVAFVNAGCYPGSIFEDQAELCSTSLMYSGEWIWCASAFGQCYLYPHDLARLLTIEDPQFEIQFDVPVSRFGGWFSRALDPINANDVFEFFDDQGTLIHTDSFLVPVGCHWLWYGWSAGSTPIQTIRVNSAGAVGSFMILDDLQVDFWVPTPVVYCTSGTSSSGCAAAISASANPNVAHTAPCQISVLGVEGQRSGIVFYGLAAQVSPWCSGGSSYLCIKAPVMRTGVQSSGGTLSACDGSLALDWNAFQLAHPGALGAPWAVGNKAYVQGWFRDPTSCKTTSLSNAVELSYSP
jgi:hypothetical protein